MEGLFIKLLRHLMGKAPTRAGLRDRGIQSDHLETGSAGLEGEGAAVRIGQRDDIRVLALPLHFIRLSIPERHRISRTGQQDVVKSLWFT